MCETDDEHLDLEARLTRLGEWLDEGLSQEKLKQFDTYPQIGKYQIQKRFAGQQRSKVFLAFDIELKRQVVVKFYSNESGGSQSVNSILEEAQALSQTDSPHVAKCYGVERVEDHLLLVMEFVGEKNLQDIYDSCPYSVAESLKIVEKINQGLTAIHRQNLLHRDLKPQNVAIHESGTPKIIDFGLATSSCDRTAKETVGTSSYIPPERIHNRINEIGPHTDVFGLGAILYFLLTGNAPFAADSESETYQRALDGVITPPHELNAQTPIDVSQFCMSLLAANTSDRLQNTAQVEQQLKTLYRRRSLRKGAFIAFLTGMAAVIGLIIYGLLPESYQLPKNPEVSSVSLMREHQNDFQISVSFKTGGQDSDASTLVRLTPEDPVQVPVSDSMKLQVTATEDCYIALIGFEPMDPIDTSQGFESYPIFPSPNRNAIKLSKNALSEFEISDLVASKGVDYLVVFASTHPWTFVDVAQLLDDSAANPARVFVWRGIRKVNEKRAVWRFPYQLQ